jgi:predicted regulator of Ras-like GTPase activity (Roadblock/LC7/MglB family)
MQAMLQKMNAVPGVIGTMLCDPAGSLLAEAFPPTFDRGRLRSVAAILAERTAALETVLGQAGTVDLRFGTARVVVKAGDGVRLVFLCHPSTNLSLLGLSAAGVLHHMATSASTPGPAAAASTGKLFQTLQRINALIERAGGNPYKLRGRIALQADLPLELIEPSTPDDPAQLERLRAAAQDVLGQEI